MKFIVLSDIHANLTAFKAVIKDFRSKYNPDGLILLGDLVNYGMRPNETIKEIEHLSQEYPLFCNLCGNHEKAVIEPDKHLVRFSTERGKRILKYTLGELSNNSVEYLLTEMEGSGKKDFEIEGKKLLCIHGSLEDSYWGKINLNSINNEEYASYDYVFSGHTHLPHYWEMFYKANSPALRNQKKTIFLNPGSVGQPRNQNPNAQYLYVDLQAETFHHNGVEYDINLEQGLYGNEVDNFYKTRLSKGI